jgi:hypothetical protein
MAKLPVGKSKNQGKKRSPEHLPEWVVNAIRLPLKRERTPRHPNLWVFPTNRFEGLLAGFRGFIQSPPGL